MLHSELLNEAIDQFIRSPFPLWEHNHTDKLVAAAYEELQNLHIHDRLSYTTEAALLKKESKCDKQFLVSYDQKSVYLETPNTATLNGFYAEHGLFPLTSRELVKEKAATKLKYALSVLEEIPECIDCVAGLVNCIQVITSEGPDYDTSYSHPEIPFTIFVSVCEDDKPISSIRVAESILHEAMHLKLTLLEQHLQLIDPETSSTFYSPWRDEQRPVRGVLHGLFVFIAIQLFYGKVLTRGTASQEVVRFIECRRREILNEIHRLDGFEHTTGLTLLGKKFIANLMKGERS